MLHRASSARPPLVSKDPTTHETARRGHMHEESGVRALGDGASRLGEACEHVLPCPALPAPMHATCYTAGAQSCDGDSGS